MRLTRRQRFKASDVKAQTAYIANSLVWLEAIIAIDVEYYDSVD
jgi:hypothetical protein